MPQWQSGSMFTYFDDHMPTCLYAFELICLDALMITYSYFEMLRWSHAHMHWYSHIWYLHTCAHTWIMKCLLPRRLKRSCSRTCLCSNALTIVLECWDDWEIRGMCTWVLKYSYACMLSWSSVSMFTCFVDNLQSFDFPLMIKCLYVYLLKWSHAPMLTFFDVHCFDGRMLPCLYALMITCHLPVCHHSHMTGCFDDYLFICSNTLMIACSHALIFTCLISTHECTHDDREMSIVLEA